MLKPILIGAIALATYPAAQVEAATVLPASDRPNTAAPTGLTGDAVRIRRIQGNTIFKEVNTIVGAAVEYTDNFFNIDVTGDEIVFDAISGFSVNGLVYTFDGLDFDDDPATANVVTSFSSFQIFGPGAAPLGADRVAIAPNGKISFSFPSTNGSSSGFIRIGLGAAAPAAVPEPASWAMIIMGFGAVGGAIRRRTGDVPMPARG